MTTTTTETELRITSTSETIETLTENYGVQDRLGREIGGEVKIARDVWRRSNAYGVSREHADGALAGVHDRVLAAEANMTLLPVTFSIRPWATRNGRTYGAVQRSKQFATELEARAEAALYFKKARARASKR